MFPEIYAILTGTLRPSHHQNKDKGIIVDAHRCAWMLNLSWMFFLNACLSQSDLASHKNMVQAASREI